MTMKTLISFSWTSGGMRLGSHHNLAGPRWSKKKRCEKQPADGLASVCGAVRGAEKEAGRVDSGSALVDKNRRRWVTVWPQSVPLSRFSSLLPAAICSPCAPIHIPLPRSLSRSSSDCRTLLLLLFFCHTFFFQSRITICSGTNRRHIHFQDPSQVWFSPTFFFLMKSRILRRPVESFILVEIMKKKKEAKRGSAR